MCKYSQTRATTHLTEQHFVKNEMQYGSISVKVKMYFKCLVHCCYPYVLFGSSRGMDLNFKGLKLIPDSVVTQFSLKNSNC